MPVAYDSTIGLDAGASIIDFATMSDDTKIYNPKFLRDSIKRLKLLQRGLSRKKRWLFNFFRVDWLLQRRLTTEDAEGRESCFFPCVPCALCGFPNIRKRVKSLKKKGSKNRDKAKYMVEKRHEKITNQRKDFLHKISSRVVSENRVIAIGTIDVAGMIRKHHLVQEIEEVSWSEFFRKLEHGCEWYRKTLLRLGQFEPASRICRVCGSINRGLNPPIANAGAECAAFHDRDVNGKHQHKEICTSGSKQGWRNSTGGQPECACRRGHQ